MNPTKDINETTTYRVTITLNGAELSVDEQARNALLTEFRSRIGHLVEGLHRIDADQGEINVSKGTAIRKSQRRVHSVASN